MKTGEILIGLRKVSAVKEANDWLQLDEASRPFVKGIVWFGFVFLFTETALGEELLYCV